MKTKLLIILMCISITALSQNYVVSGAKTFKKAQKELGIEDAVNVTSDYLKYDGRCGWFVRDYKKEPGITYGFYCYGVKFEIPVNERRPKLLRYWKLYSIKKYKPNGKKRYYIGASNGGALIIVGSDLKWSQAVKQAKQESKYNRNYGYCSIYEHGTNYRVAKWECETHRLGCWLFFPK